MIGPSAAVHDHPDALVALCVASPGNPRGRLALAARLGLAPERYATLDPPHRGRPALGDDRRRLGAARRASS